MDTSQNTLSQQELDEIINQHRLWLKTDGKEGQQAYLSGQRLVGLNFRGAFLRRANLVGASLVETSLERAYLGGADLQGADLQGANLERAYLKWASLEGAILEGTNLQGANLERAHLEGAILEGAILEGAILEEANLQGTNLERANLERAILDGANLRMANLKEAVLNNTDITVARNWQQAIGINTTLTDNLSQKLQQQNQEIKQLKAELEAAKVSEQAGGQNTEEIKRLNAELEQKQKEQSETEKQLHQLQTENERYRLELESKNKILSNQINDAQKALAETFKDSADQQIQKHNKAAECVGQLAIFLICLDAVLIFIFLSIHWFGGKTPTSGWSLAVYSFPVLIILVLATTLLRHQKKLLDEVRHFAAVKQQIELYSGLLKASQHAAAHLNDPDKSAEYVQETFSQIRTKLLQHNFTAAPTDNKDNDTSSGVDKLTEKLLEKMADAISKSGKNAA